MFRCFQDDFPTRLSRPSYRVQGESSATANSHFSTIAPLPHQSRSLESQQPTTSDMRSSNTTTPSNLNLLDIVVLISQIRPHLLHPLVSRVQHDSNVRAVFVQVRGAVQVVVADSHAVGVRADEAGEVRERPQAFGDFVVAVLDQDELFVVVVVCRAVLDDEPPVGGIGLA
jgi:hypothetical protein